MSMDITTPALLFPAISLLLLAYTNRFLALAGVIRALAGRLAESDDVQVRRQIHNLRVRISLIKWMQGFGIVSILLCMISMLCLFVGREPWARLSFGVSMVLMVVSLGISIWETLLSGEALKHELQRCEMLAAKRAGTDPKQSL
ncbi:hypothetical protein Pcar_0434 [Syntrophotalea carbinolica DSM 2380]|uniref:DUF2721 domain-containing protein n=1 Tax=Syntrophotalea carbinolica (strain DSM 2380 / NBRC 103641 / GraBd1) TaxID=338963 RepID=Q3A7F0_SYNC1|nr:hypothetical protein Pcar_0434 [Syntrophotalea carbinolica DSM 2380]